MNGTIDTTSAKQTFIGGVHDGINLQCRDISSDDFNAAHRLCLSHAASLTWREQIRPMSSHDSHVSHAGARRLTGGRLDDVNPNVDQGSPNYHGQETEDAHYRVVH